MPTYRDNPNIAKFRDDVKSTERSVNIPIAPRIPNVTNIAPPIAGSGMVERTAPNLPTNDKIIHNPPVDTIHVLLAICKVQIVSYCGGNKIIRNSIVHEYTIVIMNHGLTVPVPIGSC